MCLAYARLASVLFTAIQRLLVTAVQHREAGLDITRRELHMNALSIQNSRYMLGFPLTGPLGAWARTMAETSKHDLLSANSAITEMHMLAAEELSVKQAEQIIAQEVDFLASSEMKMQDAKADSDVTATAAAAADASAIPSDVTPPKKATAAAAADGALATVTSDNSKQGLAIELQDKLQKQLSEIVETLAYLIGSDAYSTNCLQLQMMQDYSKGGYQTPAMAQAHANVAQASVGAGGVVMMYPGGLFYSQMKELASILQTAPFPWTAYKEAGVTVAHAKTRAAVLLVLATLMQVPLLKQKKTTIFTNEGVLSRQSGAHTHNKRTNADSSDDSDSDDEEAPQAIPVSRQVLRYLLHLLLACGNLANDAPAPAPAPASAAGSGTSTPTSAAASAANDTSDTAIPATHSITSMRRVPVTGPALDLDLRTMYEESGRDEKYDSSDDGDGDGDEFDALRDGHGAKKSNNAHESVILIRTRGSVPIIGGSSPASSEIYMMLGQLLGLLRGHAGKEPVLLTSRTAVHLCQQHAVHPSHSHIHTHTRADEAEMQLHGGHSLTVPEAVPALLGVSKLRMRAKVQLQKAQEAALMKDNNVFEYTLKALL